MPRCPTLQTTILNMLCCCPFMIRVHMPTWESYQRLFSNSSDDFYFKREQMTNILRIFLIVERNLHCFLHFDLKTLTSLSLLLLRISRLSRYDLFVFVCTLISVIFSGLVSQSPPSPANVTVMSPVEMMLS